MITIKIELPDDQAATLRAQAAAPCRKDPDRYGVYFAVQESIALGTRAQNMRNVPCNGGLLCQNSDIGQRATHPTIIEMAEDAKPRPGGKRRPSQ